LNHLPKKTYENKKIIFEYIKKFKQQIRNQQTFLAFFFKKMQKFLLSLYKV